MVNCTFNLLKIQFENNNKCAQVLRMSSQPTITQKKKKTGKGEESRDQAVLRNFYEYALAPLLLKQKIYLLSLNPKVLH